MRISRIFFPSTGRKLVRKMWQHFFHFPPDVASLLTNLTTYKNFVPQGASTSSYIANLIFWDKEPRLVEELRKRGIYYSRYVDDITISTDRKLSSQEMGEITSLVYGMLLSTNVKPNRAKREVYFKGDKMMVHRLNVDRQKPTMNKNKRDNIRTAVKRCEILAESGRDSALYRDVFIKVRGEVESLKRLHRKQAVRLMQRLERIQPE